MPDLALAARLHGLLALFLALGKRRGELVLVERRADTWAGRARRATRSRALDRLVAVVAVATVVVYAAYTVSAHDSHALPLTIPFVAFGLGRYVFLLRRRGLGEEPDQVLVSDKPILVAVARWGSSAPSCSRWASARPRRPRSAGAAARCGRCRPLELLEPGVDAAPARRHEIDEQSQIVDAGVALGEHLLLEPLEPARSSC